MADVMLITIEQAFRQLRIFLEEGEDIANHEDREDVAFRVKVATGLVLDYIKDRENKREWTAETAPAPVQASILLILSDLWEHRGGSASDDIIISRAVRDMLHRWRDPALA